LKTFDHRPFEEQFDRFLVAAEPALDLRPARGTTNPDVAVTFGPKRIAEPALDRAKGSPSFQVVWCEPADFGFAWRVIVPELDARSVVEGDEHPRRGRRPAKTVVGHLELVDDQGMEQPDQVCAGRNTHSGPDFIDRASAPHAVASLDHQDTFARPSKISCAGEAVMTGSDDNRVPLF